MFAYNLLIFLYVMAIRAALPFSRKARLWVRGRRRIFRRLREAFADNERVVWVHAASLGEFEQGRPLIEAIKAQHPEYKLLLTFFSPSGYEVRKDYKGADHVFYLPADAPANVRRFLRTVRPEVAIFVKYEFWLNYLRGLRRIGCRTFLVSAIFRRDSVFFRWYGGAYRRALATYETIFAQHGLSLQLLAELGVNSAVEAGDTRFDRVAAIAAAARGNGTVERFGGDGRLLVAGSTWPPDEATLMEAAAQFDDLKLVIVPHETEPARIDRLMALLDEKGLNAVRYSDERADLAAARVLVVDTIGLLSSLYRYGWLTYIGGGFGAGIHNTLEAAVFGRPVAFGPNYRRFMEAREMVDLGCARSVATAQELEAWIGGYIAEPLRYGADCRAAADYVASNRGAADLIINSIFGGK
ncbi:MAG: 3-deoxy-D-manno-octulosonic acid transferase [Rikenellaceae bacterium]|jgi:3-deoxy-D-manno-octulosonic-acid transferase|nr:3-deoxy-D-manno-octulosonic acid transferase [Rikenellaceae bacterium]